MDQQLPSLEDIRQPITAGRDNVLRDFYQYLTETAIHRNNHPHAQYDSPQELQSRARAFENIVKKYKRAKGMTLSEKLSLNVVNHYLKKTKAALRPNIFNRIRYSYLVDKPLRWVRGYHINDRAYRDVSEPFLKTNAVQSNYQNIHAQLKEMGYDMKVDRVRDWLSKGLDGFDFHVYDVNNPKTDYLMQVRRVPKTSAYEIEKVTVSHYNTAQDIRAHDKGPSETTTFRTDSSLKFNLTEMQAITRGDPVLKNIGGKELFVTRNLYMPDGLRALDFDVSERLKELPITGIPRDKSMEDVSRELSQGLPTMVLLSTPSGDTDRAILRLAHDQYTDRIGIVVSDRIAIAPSTQSQAQAQSQNQNQQQSQAQPQNLHTAQQVSQQIKAGASRRMRSGKSFVVQP